MSGLDAALLTGATTRALCWRLARRDGVVMGFTDHDRDIAFDGVTFAAGAALEASAVSSQAGAGTGEMDAAGALASDAITEADLRAGVYDGAEVELWEVDWTDVSARRLLAVFTLGEVERRDLAFRAEMRSTAAVFGRRRGRVQGPLCDVERLGDARCGVDLDAGGFRFQTVVDSVAGPTLSIPDATAAGFFDFGRLRMLDGGAAGFEADIRLSRQLAAGTELQLWREVPAAIAAGDAIEVTAGCDRSADTCRNKFANFERHRGFWRMPPASAPADYAVIGDPDQDGGSRHE